ncbi:uncharacterized protein LOC142325804 [Lycorma delicatula]|uniref:uncharacterized protein LOC142325804 n=1 Tax=Lycorma delicatula TaxID=130591 RepID=UPI003F512716
MALTEQYTLMMIRRDSLTTKSHYPITIHWIVYNLSIDDLAGKLPANSVVGKYQAPNPPSRKAGYYIYMFVVFRHEKVYNVSFTRLEGNSRRTVLSNWLNRIKSNINLCGPVAGFQFRAANFCSDFRTECLKSRTQIYQRLQYSSFIKEKPY